MPSLDVITIAFFPRNIHWSSLFAEKRASILSECSWASHNVYGRRIGKKVYYKLRPDCLSIWLVCALNSYLCLLLHSATSNPFIFGVILSGPSCSKGRYRYSPDKSLSSRYTGYLSTGYRCIRWAIALSVVWTTGARSVFILFIYLFIGGVVMEWRRSWLPIYVSKSMIEPS